MPTIGSVARSASLLRILQAAACRGWAVKAADCAMLAGFVTLGEQQHAALAGLSWTVRLQARHACVPYDFLGLKDSQRLVWIVALSFWCCESLCDHRRIVGNVLMCTCIAVGGSFRNERQQQLQAVGCPCTCCIMQHDEWYGHAPRVQL